MVYPTFLPHNKPFNWDSFQYFCMFVVDLLVYEAVMNLSKDKKDVWNIFSKKDTFQIYAWNFDIFGLNLWLEHSLYWDLNKDW